MRPHLLVPVADVLLWFWGTSFLTVWVVFHDPSIDYRVLLAWRDRCPT